MDKYVKKTTEEKTRKFIEKAHNVWGYKYDYSQTIYEHSTKPLIIGYNGIFYKQTPIKHLLGKKIEENITLMSTIEFIEKSKLIWGNDRFGYDKCEYKGTHKKITLYDFKKKKNIEQSAKSHLSGFEVVKYTDNDFVKNSNLIHDYKYTYENTKYKGNIHSRVDITCPEHGDFNIKASSHLNSFSKCPKCMKQDPETAIHLYLKNNKIDYVRQHKSKECMNNGYELPFDFYIPSKNLYIDFHGKYHDLNNIDIFLDDKTKHEYCEDNYINLLILNDSDNYLEIIKHYIR